MEIIVGIFAVTGCFVWLFVFAFLVGFIAEKFGITK